MTDPISRDHFKQLMAAFGYVFNAVSHCYSCDDGTIILDKQSLRVVNKVLYSDEKKFVRIYYPNTYDDLELMAQSFDGDFKYHLSYNVYKDFCNIGVYGYESSFDSRILHLYATVSIDDGNDINEN